MDFNYKTNSQFHNAEKKQMGPFRKIDFFLKKVASSEN